MNNKTTTREEMLKECIEYAESHGWISGIKDEHLDQWIELDRYYAFIFSHAFCKAVFHNNNYSEYDQELWVNSQCYEAYHDDMAHFRGEAWQFHIQQMAVADDPLLYMYNYIKN